MTTGEVHSLNDRWHTILGYEPGDLADNFDAWDELVHPDDVQARLDAWEAHLSGRAPRYEAEFRMRHKAGHWVWLQARGQAVRAGPDGRATRLVGTRQDISEHKLIQQGLQALAHTRRADRHPQPPPTSCSAPRTSSAAPGAMATRWPC